MRICQLSTPHIPTPPRAYGGSELVAGYVTEELVRRGHEVTLFAAPESRTSARLVSIPQADEVSPFDYRELVHVTKALQYARDFDIIHNHCLYAGPALASLSTTPMVSTLHYIHHILRCFPNHNYVGVSQSQLTLAKNLNIRDVIHHGIDTDQFYVERNKDDYLLFLGRFHPNKGTHLAIEAAVRSEHSLLIAAPPPPMDQQEYFDSLIKPHLKGRISYLGEVEGRMKASLLAKAKALILPLTWDEPFGLVLLEAMASGTPVVATNRGSVPELVVDGKTGFVVEDMNQMVEAIENVHHIHPDDCRAHVQRHFSIGAMVDRYEALYKRILSEQRSRRW